VSDTPRMIYSEQFNQNKNIFCGDVGARSSIRKNGG
jgi:hypothetical protein